MDYQPNPTTSSGGILLFFQQLFDQCDAHTATACEGDRPREEGRDAGHRRCAETSSADKGVWQICKPGNSHPPPQPIDVPVPQPAPEPIRATPQMVEEWIEEEFKRFKPNNSHPPQLNQEVLWKGLKRGRSGAVSTQVEYFNGVVRDIERDSDGRGFLFR